MDLKALLENKMDNHLLPFFWQHGEDEKTLREYMNVIHDANIKAVCIESRPHEGFLKDKWWKDLDAIFDEAEKLDMKVWILDDLQFPSGYANGTLKDGYTELHRQFITYKKIAELDNEALKISEEDKKAPLFEKTVIEKFMMKDSTVFDDDECLGFVAVKEDVRVAKENDLVSGKIYGLYKTRNRGPHRDYINMASKKAVRKFIDVVYEEHYKHYKQYFGNIFEGFFSDEPEIGNGHLYGSGLKFFEMEDLPYSEEIDQQLKDAWGEDFLQNIGKIFFGKNVNLNIEFMDILTNTIKEDFSYQIGNWCRERGVKYIGHSIEDHNQHTRTGSGLGHYFRGLKGQDYAGIDDIGGQVIPGMEDKVIQSKFTGTTRDGTFYHFTLGKLASSAAAIDPIKKGNSMCEIFGNYGWEEGVYMEKYLIDHFLVRGINNYVPHAFSPKAFPDPDCPPHFYAHGNNPQYRHFGELMKYTNRICNLISNGKAVRKVALLYQAEADWSGKEYMKEDVVARYLIENQIDFDFIPSDVFTSSEYDLAINDDCLIIGKGTYTAVVIPSYPLLRSEAVDALNTFKGKVIAIDKIPEITLGSNNKLVAEICSLENLKDSLLEQKEVHFKEASKYLRYLHYQNNNDVFMFINEGSEPYKGKLLLPKLENPIIYDAWKNKVYKLDYKENEEGIEIDVNIEDRKSLIIYSDDNIYKAEESLVSLMVTTNNTIELNSFKRSLCTSKNYPLFKDEKMVNLPDSVEKEYPKFGGYIKYETEFNLCSKKAYLEIDDKIEGVEVYLNGNSLGIEIVPKYCFDLSPYLQDGNNKLEIVLATTLERFVEKTSKVPGAKIPEPQNLLGIKGTVKILY